MSPYADHARPRPEPLPQPIPAAAAPERVSAPRLTINRRPAIVDMPAGGFAATANTSASANAELAPELELASEFDVPAFLRRQEG